MELEYEKHKIVSRAYERWMLDMLLPVLQALDGCDYDETLGHVKVYDRDGQCLGYLLDVVARLLPRKP